MHRFLVATTVVGALALPATAGAATFTVTDTADTLVGVACADPAHCSLRGAITAANAVAGDDIVAVVPGTYHLANGELSITSGTDLRRAGGTGTVTIDADGLSRVLHSTAGMNLTNLTITGGRATNNPGGAGAVGGGIYTTADLALDGVTVSVNEAVGDGVGDGLGGGLYTDGQLSTGGAVSTFSDNSATATGTDAAYGGGIYVASNGSGNLGGLALRNNDVTSVAGPSGGGGLASDGTGTIHFYNSDVDANTVTANGGGAATGGGIASTDGTFTVRGVRVTDNTASSTVGPVLGGGMATAGTPTIDGTTFAGNVAATGSTPGTGALGGGLWSFSPSTIAITNSTFTANTASASGAPMASGGGLATAFGPATLTGVTVTANTATNTVTPANASAGGAAVTGGPFTLRGSILSGNTQSAGADCAGVPTSGDGNVLFAAAGPTNPDCPITLGTNDKTTDAPGLGALADNGGPTPTMLPIFGSPALDRYPAVVGACAGLTVDQRGDVRPLDSACDAGAAESRPASGGGGGGGSTPASGGGVPQCQDLDASTAFATPADLQLDCSATVWSWQVSTPPAHGTVGAVGPTGQLTYTPADGFSGDDSFQYVALGAGGSSTPATAVVHVGPGPASGTTATSTAKTCTPRTVTIRLNAHGVHFTRVRVSVAGVLVKPQRTRTVWKATFALKGTPGQKVRVHVSGRRTDGKLVTTTRVLTAC